MREASRYRMAIVYAKHDNLNHRQSAKLILSYIDRFVDAITDPYVRRRVMALWADQREKACATGDDYWKGVGEAAYAMWPIIDQISTDQLVPFGDLLNCEYYVGRLADNVARVKAGMKFKDRMVQRRKDWLGGE